MALEMQNFGVLSPPVVRKITWWTLMYLLEHYFFRNYIQPAVKMGFPAISTFSSILALLVQH